MNPELQAPAALCRSKPTDPRIPRRPEIECEFSGGHDGACQYLRLVDGRGFRRPVVIAYRWRKPPAGAARA